MKLSYLKKINVRKNPVNITLEPLYVNIMYDFEHDIPFLGLLMWISINAEFMILYLY